MKSLAKIVFVIMMLALTVPLFADIFYSHIKPNADDTLDVGSDAYSWNDAWFDGDVNVGGKVIGNSGTFGTVGDGSPFTVYGQISTFDNIGSASPIEIWLKSSTNKEAAIYLYPDTGAVAANKWRIYVPDYEAGNFAIQNYYGSSWTNKLSINSATGDTAIQGKMTADDILITNYIESSLIPNISETRDLGSSSKKWRDLYLFRNLTDGTKDLSIADANAAYAHVSNDGTDHSFIDQNVATTASPSFAGLTVDTNTILVDTVNHRLGIGGTPARLCSIIAAATAAYFQLTNSTLGITSSHGLEFYAATSGESGVVSRDGTLKIRADGGTLYMDSSAGITAFQEAHTTTCFWSSSLSKDQFCLGVYDAIGNQFILTQALNHSKDHDHDLQTNPTFYVHSDISPDVSNNQWGSFAHDQTNFVITTGANVGAGTMPTTIENALVFAPRGVEVARVDSSGLGITGDANVYGTLDVNGIATLGDGSLLAAATEAGDPNLTIADKKYVDDQFSPVTYAGGESVTFGNGLIIKMGRAQSTTDDEETFTFGTAFPTACLSVVITREYVDQETALGLSEAPTKTGFKINRAVAIDGTQNFDWIAIG